LDDQHDIIIDFFFLFIYAKLIDKTVVKFFKKNGYNLRKFKLEIWIQHIKFKLENYLKLHSTFLIKLLFYR